VQRNIRAALHNGAARRNERRHSMSLRETMPATLVETVSHTVDDWRGRLARRRAWRRAYDRTFRELSAYTDREMADLGISRIDIAELSRQEADRTVGRH
jgi:uncharacterized protein YjiS (DUF1127 family)